MRRKSGSTTASTLPVDFALAVEQMPQLAGGDLEAHDLGLAALPANDAAIGELAAAAGIERRLGQRDLAGPRVGHVGLNGQGLGLLVTKEVHAAS